MDKINAGYVLIRDADTMPAAGKPPLSPPKPVGLGKQPPLVRSITILDDQWHEIMGGSWLGSPEDRVRREASKQRK